MTPARVLLVQLRDGDDIMADHEKECVRVKIGERRATLDTVNAVTTPADPAWAKGYDAVIVGGSGAYSVHCPTTQAWVEPLRVLLDAVLDRDVPGFGICFGHQLVGHHLGGLVQTCERRTEIGTVDLRLTDAGSADPVFSRLEPTFRAQAGHSDVVHEVPEHVTVLAENELVHAQAFRVNGRRFWSTQFHPDMTGHEARARYLAYQENLKNGTPDKAEQFMLGLCCADVLLGHFLDEALEG